ncbi:hypothetical protein Mth01_38140 [Sphaerimonospora thailandensis]|uniref:Uncharacterized protein n=1 Tax=Sphaerimonospora thailandensis TaxID=795644 RepID=A0A8J3R8Z1_9ACTN|nr:hypothetical protein Mth01_38140 [Sphaerimonospora thailandensis]
MSREPLRNSPTHRSQKQLEVSAAEVMLQREDGSRRLQHLATFVKHPEVVIEMPVQVLEGFR